MSALPDPTFAPVLAHDAPVESPPSGLLISALTVRLIYSDGYGGVSLPGPAAALTITGGAGRVTIAGHAIPLSVRRVIVFADSITTVPAGGGAPHTTTDTVLYYKTEPSPAGTMPPIELWAHDTPDFSDGIWSVHAPPPSNNTSLPRPPAAVPDPVAAPVGATLSGLGSFADASFLKVRLAFAYETAGPYIGPRGILTEIGPLLDLIVGTPQDTVHIPAQSGLPPGAVGLWVWVFGYADGTNLSHMYRYHVPLSGGACAAFTFSTHDVEVLFGVWNPIVYPLEYEDCWLNPSGLDLLRLTYNRGDGPNVVCYDTDSDRSRIYVDGDVALQTPFAELTTSPPVLVGRDPATHLPAYCPTPPVVAIAPASPPPAPPAVDPNEFRCNIAQYVAGQMELAYGVAAQKINNMNSAQWTLIGLGGPLAGVILSLLGVVFPPLFIITGFGVSLLALLGRDRQLAELLPLGPPAVAAMAQALYCALQPDADGLYEITGTTLFDWSYNLTAFGASFSGNQLAEVRLLITVYQIEYWHNLALQAGATGSTLCAGYSCSGLLP